MQLTTQDNIIEARLVLNLQFKHPNGGENGQEIIEQHLQALAKELLDFDLLSPKSQLIKLASFEHKLVVEALEQDPLEKEELSSFLADRIENGELSPEDIPAQMARYGLMDRSDFQNEMLERMEQAQFGRFAESASSAAPREK
jgi:hypothetical protein